MAANEQLRCYMNLMAFDSYPENASAPRGRREEQFQSIQQAGFSGLQFADPAASQDLLLCRALHLGLAGSGRINTPYEAASLAERLAGDGYECATLHVGWGIEEDDQACRLIESVFEASARTALPLYIETHRATICQDLWRTVGFVRRFPDIRFNADFSHWYAGQEMVYGGFEKKMAFIQPVIERVRFIHGRIANPGSIQVPVQPGAPYVTHFEQLWTACFRSFLRNSTPDDFIYFAPELLSPTIYYARTYAGEEENDRWQESLLLNAIAEKCFSQARAA